MRGRSELRCAEEKLLISPGEIALKYNLARKREREGVISVHGNVHSASPLSLLLHDSTSSDIYAANKSNKYPQLHND
jgi:hypothetical protein